jgi:N-acetylglucosamine-6-phosphate deacetylase
MTSLRGNLLLPTGWVRGLVSFGERIASIEGIATAEPDGNAPYVLPGFIDLHVHGGGGRDLMEGAAALAEVARLHARHGTTAWCPTTVTAPPAELEVVLRDLGEACRRRRAGEARLLGVHLEGPFISADRLGAQPSHARAAARDELSRQCSLAPIRIVTLAPEIADHLQTIAELNARGIRVQLGHSAGGYDEGVAALKHGAAGFTHLYNAMTGLHHREPGLVGAALGHAEYAELIPDLEHVHPGAMRVALRAIPRLYCVTDATAAAGMPDGDYALGGNAIVKCGGGVRLADGTIAGSALTMDQALRNLVSLGLPLADASRRLSRYPAEYLGLTDRGRLTPEAWADLIVLDRELRIIAVFSEGECLWAR